LIKGSVALFSNSGNFTTTIAVYIHAFNNDDRSQAAVVYSEPGGYYEHGLKSDKPIVACVVGRWKAKLTKSCGHAGSLAGSGDDAEAKEGWFKEYFGVNDIYTPENPVCSKKGALVTNIAHIPEALTAVMKLNGKKPDFEPRGNLSLKCWFGSNNGVALPKELDIQQVKAIEPYNEQIEALKQQVGAQISRETLKDASGASKMDPKTQVSQIHNVSILDASNKTFEDNLVFALTHSYPSASGTAMANAVLNAYVNLHGQPVLAAATASREAGNSPNTVQAGAVSIIGKKKAQKAMNAAEALLDIFKLTNLDDPEGSFDYKSLRRASGCG
jgi:hypothetical protein